MAACLVIRFVGFLFDMVIRGLGVAVVGNRTSEFLTIFIARFILRCDFFLPFSLDWV